MSEVPLQWGAPELHYGPGARAPVVEGLGLSVEGLGFRVGVMGFRVQG